MRGSSKRGWKREKWGLIRWRPLRIVCVLFLCTHLAQQYPAPLAYKADHLWPFAYDTNLQWLDHRFLFDWKAMGEERKLRNLQQSLFVSQNQRALDLQLLFRSNLSLFRPPDLSSSGVGLSRPIFKVPQLQPREPSLSVVSIAKLNQRYWASYLLNPIPGPSHLPRSFSDPTPFCYSISHLG